MNIEQCYKVGYVSKTHGLNGEVTIVMMPECPDLSAIETLFIQHGNSLVPYFIKAASLKGDKAYIGFEEVSDIDKASELKGLSLYLPKEARPRLPRGEFYNDEVVGFEVFEGDTPLGLITDVMEAGPNRFLALNYIGKEVLIPIAGPFIKSVNKTKKKIVVELPDGFLDI